jgi:hypothetical protein
VQCRLSAAHRSAPVRSHNPGGLDQLPIKLWPPPPSYWRIHQPSPPSQGREHGAFASRDLCSIRARRVTKVRVLHKPCSNVPGMPFLGPRSYGTSHIPSVQYSACTSYGVLRAALLRTLRGVEGQPGITVVESSDQPPLHSTVSTNVPADRFPRMCS